MKDHRLLDGRAVRDRILDEVAARVRQAAATHTIGRLVSVTIGEQKEAAVYVRGQVRAAEKVGLRFESQSWPSTLSQQECKARLVAMNDDADVLGVILQRPVPRHVHGRSLASAIHPLKDIEGMNPASIGDIVYNDQALAPCTAAASVELIKATGLTLHGLEVVIEVDDLGSIKPREFCFGAELTDWEFATRALSFDGLETYADGRQLRVRRAAKQLYRTIFKRGQHPVMGLEVGIHHIASGADKSGSPALENGDTAKALTGAAAEEAAKVKADERTHRRPVGAAEKSNVSHGEAPGNAGWTNEANLKRRRKDDATLTLAASPDIRLHHYVRLEGWGGKVDGDWILPTIKHGLIKGEFPTTQLTLARAVSSSASSAAGIPFAQ